MMKLTSEQIHHIDEINRDRKANKEALLVALNFHTNGTNELIKKERAWWDEIAEIHSLDLWEIEYKVDTKNGAVVVVESGT